MIVHSGYDRPYFCTVGAQRTKQTREESCKSFVVAGIGGRGGTRTRGPLLAMQVGKNTKCFVWCRLHGKSAKFPLSKCPEVVPNRQRAVAHEQISVLTFLSIAETLSRLIPKRRLLHDFGNSPPAGEFLRLSAGVRFRRRGRCQTCGTSPISRECVLRIQ